MYATVIAQAKNATGRARILALLCKGVDTGAPATKDGFAAPDTRMGALLRRIKMHDDDEAVDAFAEVMKAKLQRSREEKSRGGGQTASASRLTYHLLEHLEKGDPVDVANFCMMLHQNGQSIDAVVVNAYRFAASSDHSETV